MHQHTTVRVDCHLCANSEMWVMSVRGGVIYLKEAAVWSTET